MLVFVYVIKEEADRTESTSDLKMTPKPRDGVDSDNASSPASFPPRAAYTLKFTEILGSALVWNWALEHPHAI